MKLYENVFTAQLHSALSSLTFESFWMFLPQVGNQEFLVVVLCTFHWKLSSQKKSNRVLQVLHFFLPFHFFEQLNICSELQANYCSPFVNWKVSFGCFFLYQGFTANSFPFQVWIAYLGLSESAKLDVLNWWFEPIFNSRLSKCYELWDNVKWT